MLARQEGVESVSVNLANASAVVRLSPEIDAAQIPVAVEKIGYHLTERDPDDQPRDMVEHYRGDEAVQWRVGRDCPRRIDIQDDKAEPVFGRLATTRLPSHLPRWVFSIQ